MAITMKASGCQFKIFTPDRVYLIEASNPTIRTNWVEGKTFFFFQFLTLSSSTNLFSNPFVFFFYIVALKRFIP